jgi:hypothetical protein
VDFDQVTQVLGQFGVAWPRTDMTQETAVLWAAALEDLHPDDGAAAAGKLMTTSKFMPSIAEFREAANTERRTREGVAKVGDLPASKDPSQVDMLRKIIANVKPTDHRHHNGQACPTCDHMAYDREILMTESDPTCLRCGVKHERAPTCPLCGAHHYATRLGPNWLCCYCNGLFTGQQDEWNVERHREHRERIALQRSRFLRVYGERYNIATIASEAASERDRAAR